MPNTPIITNSNGKAVPGSIALLEKKKIGGVDQWLLLRGKSIDNPILLFLHGGPGSAEWPLVRRYNSELEDHFIIAYWEQRGAGKSFRKGTPEFPELFSAYIGIGQFVNGKANEEIS